MPTYQYVLPEFFGIYIEYLFLRDPHTQEVAHFIGQFMGMPLPHRDRALGDIREFLHRLERNEPGLYNLACNGFMLKGIDWVIDGDRIVERRKADYRGAGMNIDRMREVTIPHVGRMAMMETYQSSFHMSEEEMRRISSSIDSADSPTSVHNSPKPERRERTVVKLKVQKEIKLKITDKHRIGNIKPNLTIESYG